MMTSLIGAFRPLTTAGVTRALSTKVVGRHLTILDEVASTNTVAMTAAHDGAPDGAVIVADHQTAGRGRLGREWFSPARKNLYCSIILRVLPAPNRLPWLPLMSAVACARAIEANGGGRPALKWPNDLWLQDRKIGGILCESGGRGPDGAFVIVGIGLNVNIRTDEFPDEIRLSATSLLIEYQRPFDRTALLAALLLELELRRELLIMDRTEDFMNEYRVRCSTVGRRVRVDVAGQGIIEGRALGINRDGSLRVAPDQGPAVDILAGDVVHLR